ncbi:DNA (cytosine-5)-methyltransferase CMT2-like isoform X2 [Mangifera indica]|nr:DNA (cytosine-5)-methyltransferase CMT2-like isoform X2 [Mangifera indica]
MNSRTISNSNSDSKSLSLAVLGQQEAMSLQVCSERKIVRRSPRFTYTPSSDYCVRRSPRFARAGVVLNGKNKQCGLDFKNFNDKSPKRLLRSAANGQSNKATVKKKSEPSTSAKKHKNHSYLIGDPIPADEAQERWRWRYELKSQRLKAKGCVSDDDDEDKIISNVECHYAEARIGDCIFCLGDCAYIKGEGAQKHVGRILEFFKTTDGEEYFRVQWFYKAEDTVMQDIAAFHNGKRLFYSTVMNDNPVDCIISKVNVTQKPPRFGLKSNCSSSSDFYFDMEYCVEYSTFRSFQNDNSSKVPVLALTPLTKTVPKAATVTSLEIMPRFETSKVKLVLLDLYSGCGGMSTGLCMGAKLSCVDLVTRWSVDIDKSACESLKLNHPETQVRNEATEDFLELLKGWQKLCKRYAINIKEKARPSRTKASKLVTKDVSFSTGAGTAAGEFEVASIVDICYGDPNKRGKRGLKFKVHWKGYGTSEDTWEPVEGLSNCQERVRDFVIKGFKSKILPLPGDVDVICGGPPCQGISGYNRYRNVDSPLDDERNRQIVVFMDIVEFLKPKFVLMENVVDILRFDKASLGRYALSRLVHLKYQARLGIIAAGCYGLPQFRLRVFLWGAHPTEKLPQFPLPTHDVIVRYWPPPEFERNTVAYDEDQPRELEKPIVLQDAISDLPAVESHEAREEMLYEKPPETEFQRFIRSRKSEMMGFALNDSSSKKCKLYDHRPYQLSEDDYIRVCQIPKRKGANFRDLPGVVVGADNVARRDPNGEQMLLPSGKPMVPDYAFTFEQGKSKRPFARLWWDENVPTLVTFPNLHSM